MHMRAMATLTRCLHAEFTSNSLVKLVTFGPRYVVLNNTDKPLMICDPASPTMQTLVPSHQNRYGAEMRRLGTWLGVDGWGVLCGVSSGVCGAMYVVCLLVCWVGMLV